MENKLSFVTEYGRQIDCKAEGCDPVHADDGEVYPFPEAWGDPNLIESPFLDNHACRWVTRTITYSKWRPVK